MEKKEIKKNKDKELTKNQFALRLTAIIGFTILGFVSIIGAFWGNQGLKNMFIGLGILFFLVMMSAIMVYTS